MQYLSSAYLSTLKHHGIEISLARRGHPWENGQTLCYSHNSLKRNFSQTKTDKRFFNIMYETASEVQGMMKFCKAVLDVYDAHNVDWHIERSDKEEEETLSLFSEK